MLTVPCFWWVCPVYWGKWPNLYCELQLVIIVRWTFDTAGRLTPCCQLWLKAWALSMPFLLPKLPLFLLLPKLPPLLPKLPRLPPLCWNCRWMNWWILSKPTLNTNNIRGSWSVIMKPTWPGCPLFPPRFIPDPPPLFMFPLFIGPPLFMGPPLGPMFPLIGPPLGDPPRLGIGPPPRLKFPRLGNPPLKAGGGRKPRGGRLNPPRGPGPADRPESKHTGVSEV